MIASTLYNKAYVIKKMKDKDFSGLSCREMKFFYDSEEYPQDLLDMQRSLETYLSKFKEDEDMLVLAGPVIACSLAFQILLGWHRIISMAVYKDGEYEYYIAETDWEGDLKLSRIRSI